MIRRLFVFFFVGKDAEETKMVANSQAVATKQPSLVFYQFLLYLFISLSQKKKKTTPTNRLSILTDGL